MTYLGARFFCGAFFYGADAVSFPKQGNLLQTPMFERCARVFVRFFEIYGACILGGTPGNLANSAPQDLGCGIFKLSTIFAHFQPFPPISSPAWALAHGVRLGIFEGELFWAFNLPVLLRKPGQLSNPCMFRVGKLKAVSLFSCGLCCFAVLLDR